MEKRYQVCVIENGVLRHFYRNEKRNTCRFSRNKATMLTLGQAREIIRDFSDREPFIQSEWDVHFREVDENGNKK